MPQTVNEVMTADPRTVAPDQTLADAARVADVASEATVTVSPDQSAGEAALADISAASPNS